MTYGYARPWRRDGLLVDFPGQIIDAAATAGLHLVDRCVALLAAVRDDGHLQPRHSFWQLTVTRNARRRGIPLHLIAHEDVLVFAAVETCWTSEKLRGPPGEAVASRGPQDVCHRAIPDPPST